jgi:hypothetical protein
MNDLELDLALGAIGQQRTDVVVPAALHDRLTQVVATAPRRRLRLAAHRAPLRPMLRATRFAMAAAIVALAGGVLLVGIPATSPSPPPVTVDSMLSGMVVDEWSPGLIAVENDGHRDIYREPGMWGEGEIRVGRDGSVWIIWPAGRFFRLGDETMYDLDGFYDREHDSRDIGAFEVGPDGTLWAIARGGVTAFDPEIDEWSWLEIDDVHAMAIGADGTVWATTDDVLVSFDGEDRIDHPWPPANARDMNLDSIRVSDDGVVWLMWEKDRDWGTVVRFDGDEWQFDPLPSPVESYVEADVSPDGILWVAADDEIVHRSLARFDGSEWTVFGEAEGVQGWGGKQGFVPQESISASLGDSVLVDASGDDQDFPAECSGMARFDGTTWTEIPSPWCVTDADTGPDGSVWLLGPPGPLDNGLRLTVIRPEVRSRE